uniref:Uncharacterized protein n=1 Tax=Aegilops tauschii subsp. strangulata TaxID=200361 RepID=A0A453S7Q1_AEGTS
MDRRTVRPRDRPAPIRVHPQTPSQTPDYCGWAGGQPLGARYPGHGWHSRDRAIPPALAQDRGHDPLCRARSPHLEMERKWRLLGQVGPHGHFRRLHDLRRLEAHLETLGTVACPLLPLARPPRQMLDR